MLDGNSGPCLITIDWSVLPLSQINTAASTTIITVNIVYINNTITEFEITCIESSIVLSSWFVAITAHFSQVPVG